jgi:ABC-2 type transport system ATP-binding protein
MPTIEIRGLSKRYGDVLAVDDLSFTAREGTVTGFLGPNGAGKTTTLQMLLGLVAPTAGSASIDGQPYSKLSQPSRRVGAVLESTGFHPGRRARDHLRVLAVSAGLPTSRVEEVLNRVDLTEAASKRVKGFSLGMRQRLGLASALLGEPEVLILDEPANGLDPQGVHWLRTFLRSFADEGGTVLVSSHLLAEVSQLVDDVVIIAKGRLIIESPLSALADKSRPGVRVRTPQADGLLAALSEKQIDAQLEAPDCLVAWGTTPEVVGVAASEIGAVIYGMSIESFDLEQTFLELTAREGGGS